MTDNPSDPAETSGGEGKAAEGSGVVVQGDTTAMPEIGPAPGAPADQSAADSAAAQQQANTTQIECSRGLADWLAKLA